MIEAIWDSQTGHQLAYVRDQQDVFRCSDNKHVGNFRNGVIYDLAGSFVCNLGLVGQDPSSGPLPDAFKSLLLG